MTGFRYPSKGAEVVFCRSYPTHEGCDEVADAKMNRQVSPDTYFAFNPALSRRQHSIKVESSPGDNISEGEKVLENYLSSSGSSLSYWKDEVPRLRPN